MSSRIPIVVVFLCGDGLLGPSRWFVVGDYCLVAHPSVRVRFAVELSQCCAGRVVIAPRFHIAGDTFHLATLTCPNALAQVTTRLSIGRVFTCELCGMPRNAARFLDVPRISLECVCHVN
uniref:Uncharacterized protein n=1 Tax=Siphoviridae sp. ctLfk13 TaxID=2826251 RepID=A0A8S5N168_9CAUD|nr:MAG TPA: hypothetical protein [Siphoviridae sp. ctLfk13]